MYNHKIIWNITKICGWDCEFCCIDAYHVSKKNSNVLLRTKCLTYEHRLLTERGMNIFETAKEYLIRNKMELSLSDKLKVIDNIDLNTEIDFSGGDPLLNKDNHIIIEKASEKFGKENIHVTATGMGFAKINPNDLAKIAGGIDFTFDYPGAKNDPIRPVNYNHLNLIKVARVKHAGLTVKAQIPLTHENIIPSIIDQIFMILHERGIDSILLMKFIPVGRGAISKIIPPDENNLRMAIERYKSLEVKYIYPKVRLQTALQKSLEFTSDKNNNFASSHLSITPMGFLSRSPWALDNYGEPIDEFVIGNLVCNKISKLLWIADRKNTIYKSFVKSVLNKAASILY